MPDHLFSTRLVQWFLKNARAMPWRVLKGRADPYRVWISEIMLQQTTVAAILNRYEQWLNVYPSIQTLASSSEQGVLKEWQGLGYYSRARNLLKCAQLLVATNKGQLPDTADELQELPGFGPYTAAAVASIAFNRPVPLVDANVRRVMMRVLAIRAKASTQYDRRILNRLSSIIPARHPGHFNQAMMELGALICRSNEPLCNQCPVRPFCKAYARGIQELIPEPKIKIIKKIEAVVAIIQVKNKILIRQRPEKGLLAGLWEFPGGKIEPQDQSPQEALKREVLEETGLKVCVHSKIAQVVHYYTQFKVKLTAFDCSCEENIRQTSRLQLVSKKDLKKYPMPSGSAKLVDKYILRT